jgi:inorganic pyrophosphatase
MVRRNLQPKGPTMKSFLAAALLAATATGAAADFVNPFEWPQPAEGTDFWAVIEIPAGSITKYELDADSGQVIVDRYMSMPVVYPTNYGSIPSSMGGDGDPLDVLVFSREPILPGAMILVRAIGILNMIDGGEEDNKVIAVPVSAVDPTYDGIASMADLPEIEAQRIEAFFRVYKQLPDASDVVELDGFQDAAAAQAMVAAAIQAAR